MTKTEKILLSFSVTVTLFALGFMFFQSAHKVEGSVAQGSDYHSTTTQALLSGTSALALVSPKVIQLGSGTFGSIIIGATNTATINVYDGTTTSSHADSATTTLASLTSAGAGTYTFDSQYYKGLIIEVVGVATSTITYR